jgi:hypothetical protein
MNGKFGTRSCDNCGRDFEPMRGDQRFCQRACHDRYFIEERRRALAAYRKYRNQIVMDDGDEAEVA